MIDNKYPGTRERFPGGACGATNEREGRTIMHVVLATISLRIATLSEAEGNRGKPGATGIDYFQATKSDTAIAKQIG